jgi:tight adherence protein C
VSSSRLVDRPGASTMPFATVRRLFGPVLADGVAALDRIVGGNASVRRRLDGLGGHVGVEEFRLEQIVWGAAAMLLGATTVLLGGLARGSLDPLLAGVAALGGLVGGVLARDYWLSRQLARRERLMLAEFPIVADLLALAVAAGESPVEALARVCALVGGQLARDLDATLARTRSGTPLLAALAELGERTTLEPLATFVSGVVVAIERGTPLADVLHAQAVDVREVSRRALLDAGGKKEISMMLPVVFLILPVTVLFALYPGLVTLTSIAR